MRIPCRALPVALFRKEYKATICAGVVNAAKVAFTAFPACAENAVNEFPTKDAPP
jgi:hypothetical protein